VRKLDLMKKGLRRVDRHTSYRQVHVRKLDLMKKGLRIRGEF
jgi:hypothetical protein